MKNATLQKPTSARRLVRCAIYTRKSTEEGLEQEFNTLDAQREAAEAYIKSQAHEGWTCQPGRYDDGGYTGGSMLRPALGRLLADIASGRVDCVVVYKVDRLSRSLLDFARMMEVFDKHQVSFVSVTQQFNTSTSMGRLVLHVLLSFAQFEREIISERTRDKIAAARRKGKWSGGPPILGYDVDAKAGKLVVNQAEAARVRAIYQLYLRRKNLALVLGELQERGWVNKRWRTRKGKESGGNPFVKSTLHHLLTQVAYLGKIRHKNEVYPGEQAAIVEEELWQAVQEGLRGQSRTQREVRYKRGGALLKGLVYCKACACRMAPSHTTKNGTTRYRYYVCRSRRSPECPRSLPALALEKLVLDQLRTLEAGAREPMLAHGSMLEFADQGRWLERLVERIEYDGAGEKLAIHLHPGEQDQQAPEEGENS